MNIARITLFAFERSLIDIRNIKLHLISCIDRTIREISIRISSNNNKSILNTLLNRIHANDKQSQVKRQRMFCKKLNAKRFALSGTVSPHKTKKLMSPTFRHPS